ncbi:hypothetical protein HOLleu_36919 [Holothuria leucospilota]|uniref:CUB domain-containing protein n=1 Tax=Holothuria leucospilota TaxID=206669 RepID=A0A9Q0YRT3_HOLLE|nr:hypothetical protein HOLleu_36919 [Holothuria leucospilota]
MGTFRRREICQLEHTFAWTSDFNGMFLHLQSTQQELPTMTLEWESVDRSVPDECITVVTDENTTLLIMGIPSIRQQPSTCQIIVNFRPDRRVVLSFESFQMTSSNCSSYITVSYSQLYKLRLHW